MCRSVHCSDSQGVSALCEIRERDKSSCTLGMTSSSKVFQRRISGGNGSTSEQDFSAADEFSLFRGFGGSWNPFSFRSGENSQASGRHVLALSLSITNWAISSGWNKVVCFKIITPLISSTWIDSLIFPMKNREKYHSDVYGGVINKQENYHPDVYI